MANGNKVYEKTITNKIIRKLNLLPKCLVKKRLAGPMQKGQPDITGCIDGIRIEIEVKVPGNTPTPKQEEWLKRWYSVGAISFWADDADKAINKVTEIYNSITQHREISSIIDKVLSRSG